MSTFKVSGLNVSIDVICGGCGNNDATKMDFMVDEKNNRVGAYCSCCYNLKKRPRWIKWISIPVYESIQAKILKAIKVKQEDDKASRPLTNAEMLAFSSNMRIANTITDIVFRCRAAQLDLDAANRRIWSWINSPCVRQLSNPTAIPDDGTFGTKFRSMSNLDMAKVIGNIYGKCYTDRKTLGSDTIRKGVLDWVNRKLNAVVPPTTQELASEVVHV